jgi:hypothetical protein
VYIFRDGCAFGLNFAQLAGVLLLARTSFFMKAFYLAAASLAVAPGLLRL